MTDLLSPFHIERSKRDVRHFYEWLGYSWGNHIEEWFDLYGDRQNVEVHRVCIIAPRDHSKSTTLRVKALHMMLFERWRSKPMTIWLFSANKDLAANRLEEIREDLKRHPDLSRLIDTKRGGKWELRLNNGSWLKATSVGSAIRGEHPAAIILDDVLDDTGDMSSDVVQHWFRKKLTPMLSPGTSIFCVGTPMSMNDLYHTEMLENDAWVSWRSGAILNWDEWRTDSDNVEPKVLWPERRSFNFLLEQKKAMGDLAFSQEYLCLVVDDDSSVYPPTLTRKNMDMDLLFEHECLHDGRYVVGFDPSHGIGQDFSVMVVMRKDDDGNLVLVNIWRRNDFSPVKQIDQMIEYNEKYDKPTFAIESAGFQNLYESIIQQKKATLDLKMSKVSNRTLKQGLLTRLRTWFEQGRIIIPFGDDATRKEVNALLHELENHAWSNGLIVDKSKHNDIVMALAHAADQFKASIGSIAMASSSANNTWVKGGNAKPKRPQRRAGGRFVITDW